MRSRSLAFVAVLVAAVVALAAMTAPAGASSSALRPDNRPRPVPGADNGLLPERLLIRVAPGCQVLRQVGPSLRLLLDSAASRGVGLGTRSCYRPLQDQLRVRQQWTARGNSACAAAVQSGPGGQVVGTSIHGWGQAVDFSDRGGPMTFTSPAYRFLVQHAARFGWNSPGWARPGGSACPEPWHWEWLGDGGRLGGDPIPVDMVALVPASDGRGYSLVSGLGAVHHHGSSSDRGSAADTPLQWVIVGAAGARGAAGYYLVGADGGVFAFGNAPFLGSTGNIRLNQPIVDIASTEGGYWLLGADGGVFSFGNARFRGSTGAVRLNRPVVAMAPTATGQGYWLVAGDGGVFSFGDAHFAGSTGHLRLAEPIVALAPTTTGKGYWMAAADGGVFAFGDAAFLGSAAGSGSSAPIVDIAATPSGRGYWLVTASGAVLPFGDAVAYPPSPG